MPTVFTVLSLYPPSWFLKKNICFFIRHQLWTISMSFGVMTFLQTALFTSASVSDFTYCWKYYRGAQKEQKNIVFFHSQTNRERPSQTAQWIIGFWSAKAEYLIFLLICSCIIVEHRWKWLDLERSTWSLTVIFRGRVFCCCFWLRQFTVVCLSRDQEGQSEVSILV